MLDKHVCLIPAPICTVPGGKGSRNYANLCHRVCLIPAVSVLYSFCVRLLEKHWPGGRAMTVPLPYYEA